MSADRRQIEHSFYVEAGVISGCLLKAADAADGYFRCRAGQGSCQIGGNLSSMRRHRRAAYGARELYLGVRVVLPTGEIFDDLRKLKKDNTGYDLEEPVRRRRRHAGCHRRRHETVPKPKAGRSPLSVCRRRKPLLCSNFLRTMPARR